SSTFSTVVRVASRASRSAVTSGCTIIQSTDRGPGQTASGTDKPGDPRRRSVLAEIDRRFRVGQDAELPRRDGLVRLVDHRQVVADLRPLIALSEHERAVDVGGVGLGSDDGAGDGAEPPAVLVGGGLRVDL